MNARIWVQGPVDMEREGCIEVTRPEMDEYYREHRLTIPERKKMEEGSTSVHRATEWGYYDVPDSIDALLGWLDDRGKREKELRKEVAIWREDMVRLMENMKAATEAEKAKREEEGVEQPVARFSTRHKTYVDLATSNQRCLRWKNEFAMSRLGHLHSQQPKEKEKKSKANGKRDSRGTAVKVAAPSKTANKPEMRATRQTRSGK